MSAVGIASAARQTSSQGDAARRLARPLQLSRKAGHASSMRSDCHPGSAFHATGSWRIGENGTAGFGAGAGRLAVGAEGACTCAVSAVPVIAGCAAGAGARGATAQPPSNRSAPASRLVELRSVIVFGNPDGCWIRIAAVRSRGRARPAGVHRVVDAAPQEARRRPATTAPVSEAAGDERTPIERTPMSVSVSAGRGEPTA